LADSFKRVNHTISEAGLVGGGSVPRPGEVSVAHNGVLFLDELPEFPRNALEVMRQPLEERRVTIARAQMTLTFPASFILVAAVASRHYRFPRYGPLAIATKGMTKYRISAYYQIMTIPFIGPVLAIRQAQAIY
jgi:hypothetical protein